MRREWLNAGLLCALSTDEIDDVVLVVPEATGGMGHLETEFRVLDPEPRADAPDGLVVVFLLLGAMMMVFWMRRGQLQTA